VFDKLLETTAWQGFHKLVQSAYPEHVVALGC